MRVIYLICVLLININLFFRIQINVCNMLLIMMITQESNLRFPNFAFVIRDFVINIFLKLFQLFLLLKSNEYQYIDQQNFVSNSLASENTPLLLLPPFCQNYRLLHELFHHHRLPVINLGKCYTRIIYRNKTELFWLTFPAPLPASPPDMQRAPITLRIK